MNMSKKPEQTAAGDILGKLNSIEYLSPVQPIPEYADYPLSLLTPILARHISASDKGYMENLPHKHMEFELIYVLKGSLDVQFDNMSLHIRAEDGLCIKRGVTHSIECEPGTEFELIHFHHSLLFGSVISMLGNRNLTRILDNDNYTYSTFDHTTEDGAVITGHIHDIHRFMHAGTAGGELRAIGALYDIWGLGIDEHSQISDIPLTKQQSLDKWRIGRATEYIAAHYSEDILLSDIASCCEVSESECCRTFKRSLHTSPIDYINRYRVYAAAEILTNDVHGTPMSEIATQVGFNYASYFNKTFKRYIGMTPMQYRKKFNKSEAYRKNQHEFRI